MSYQYYPNVWSTAFSQSQDAGVDRRKRFGYRDLGALAARMDVVSHRLFSQTQDINFDACEITEKGVVSSNIQSENQLGRYIEESDASVTGSVFHSQLFYFTQTHSWGRLTTNQECILKLVNYFDIFPEFLDILCAFGYKDSPVDEIFSAYRFSTFTDRPHLAAPSNVTTGNNPLTSPSSPADSFFSECCYMLKYVDLHYRTTESDRPWSVRQLGVYQKFDFSTKRNIYILLQPSDRVIEVIKETLDFNASGGDLKYGFCNDWTQLHLLCLGAIREHWREYINFLDAKVISMAGRLRFSKVDDRGVPNRNHQQSAAFSNLQDLEEINDELLRLKNVLALNIKVLETMKLHMDHLEWQKEPSITSESLETFKNVVDAALREHQFHKMAVKSVYARSARILSTLRDGITIQDSHTMKTLAMIRNEGNAMAEKLTEAGIKETQTMKVLAVLALVFLPATFTSGFLDMGYLSVTSIENGLMKVQMENEMWLFLAITLSLMGVTMGAWVIWEWYQDRSSTRFKYRKFA